MSLGHVRAQASVYSGWLVPDLVDVAAGLLQCLSVPGQRVLSCLSSVAG